MALAASAISKGSRRKRYHNHGVRTEIMPAYNTMAVGPLFVTFNATVSRI
jgi:hypothetical protein